MAAEVRRGRRDLLWFSLILMTASFFETLSVQRKFDEHTSSFSSLS